MTEKLKRDNLAFGKMKNEDFLDQMNKRFDQIDTNLTKSEDRIEKRLDKIESIILPLVEFKAKHEGGNANGKYIFVTVMSAAAIIIGLINLYLKYK